MSDPERPSRWWDHLEDPETGEEVEDPWQVEDDDLELNHEQVRFLESLADQPPVPRLADSPPGLGAGGPGEDPGTETGD